MSGCHSADHSLFQRGETGKGVETRALSYVVKYEVESSEVSLDESSVGSRAESGKVSCAQTHHWRSSGR